MLKNANKAQKTGWLNKQKIRMHVMLTLRPNRTIKMEQNGAEQNWP